MLGDSASSVKKTSEATTRKIAIADDEFIYRLSVDPAYEGIDVKREALKAQSWLSNNPKGKGRKFTKKFFLNWLSRAEAKSVSTPKEMPKNWTAEDYFGPGVKTY